MGEEWVSIPRYEYELLKGLIPVVEQLQKRIKELEEEIRLLKNGRDSAASSSPPSSDLGRSNRKSLREKSGKKSGGQEGHPGNTLKITETPDEVVRHEAAVCEQCGKGLTGTAGKAVEKRQEVGLAIRKVYREHQRIQTECPHCGKINRGEFPANIKSPIQYGSEVEALVGYMSVYQYIPYRRIAAMMGEVFGLPLSEGTVDTMLERMKKNAEAPYKEIRKEVERSVVVGSDETGCHVKGKKGWLYIVQNKRNTYLFHSGHRDYKTIADAFPRGFKRGTVVSDCLSAQLKIPAAGHQLCCAHLLRELNNFIDALKSEWALELKDIIQKAIALKKGMKRADYKEPPGEVAEIEGATDKLLAVNYDAFHPKLQAFIKRLIKHRDKLYTFLHHEAVPADNNGSERGIRNVKVKTKVSGQFRSAAGADRFVAIRSVIDTAVKNGLSVFQAFSVFALSPT